LIPEIPYDIKVVADSIMQRSRGGKPFSIVAVAEGALSVEGYNKIRQNKNKMDSSDDKKERLKLKKDLEELDLKYTGNTAFLAKELEKLTGLESRLTILGHLQRGGSPSAADRLLATRLGTSCADYINEGKYGGMVAVKGEDTVLVPLKDVVGKIKYIPRDHAWLRSAKEVGTCLGDRSIFE